MAEAKAFKMIPHCTKDTITYEMDELVRCKDCQFYYEGENEVDYWMRCRLHSINTDSDNFCSWCVKKKYV